MSYHTCSLVKSRKGEGFKGALSIKAFIYLFYVRVKPNQVHGYINSSIDYYFSGSESLHLYEVNRSQITID